MSCSVTQRVNNERFEDAAALACVTHTILNSGPAPYVSCLRVHNWAPGRIIISRSLLAN